MVKPFQIQSMVPEFNSISFASHAIGWATNSSPRRPATSFASSRSKPVYSPSSPTNPMGGKSWSNPTINVPSVAWVSAASPAFSSASLLSVLASSAEPSSDAAVVSAVVAAVVSAAVVVPVLWLPQPARDIAIAPTKSILPNFFIIFFSSSYPQSVAVNPKFSPAARYHISILK